MVVARLYLVILSAYWLLFRIPWIIKRKSQRKEVKSSEQYELPRIAKRVPGFVRPIFKDLSLWLTIAFYSLAAYEILKGKALSEIISLFGLFLWAIGVLMSSWATYELGKQWSAAPEVLKDHVLVTSGPYRISRHPIYVGNGLQQLGAVFAAQSVLLLLVLLAVFVPILFLRARDEEGLFGEAFGKDYADYKSKTSGFLSLSLLRGRK